MLYQISIILSLCFLIITCRHVPNNSGHNLTPAINNENKDTSLSRILFKSKIIDLEPISVDSTMTAKFIFTNVGSKNLIIEYVNPDCTCSNYKLSSNTISPGDTGFVQLEVESNGFSGQKKVYAIMATNTEDRFYKILLKGVFIR